MGYNILKGVYLDEGFNANEAFLLEIESCAYGSSYPITKAQKETMAYLMGTFSLSQDIPIDRSTVFGHSDINSVNRPNDPVPKAQLEAFLNELIILAEAYKKDRITAPYILQIESLNSQVDTLQGVILELNNRIIDLEEQLRLKQVELDACRAEYAKLALEKNELQDKYNSLMTRYLEAAGQVQVFNTVKEYWKYIDNVLNS
jgi:hypothetical protein